MHLFGIAGLIALWGVGMIVRPAGTLFVTCLVVGSLYFAVTNSARPPPRFYPVTAGQLSDGSIYVPNTGTWNPRTATWTKE
jgi:hypothetical protein